MLPGAVQSAGTRLPAALSSCAGLRCWLASVIELLLLLLLNTSLLLAWTSSGLLVVVD